MIEGEDRIGSIDGDPTKEPVSLEGLVESALALFHSRHTIITLHGNREGYHSALAVDDAVSASGLSVEEVFVIVTSQTSITPRELTDFRNFPTESWKEFMIYFSSNILDIELLMRHPEIEKESDRRLNWEPKNSNPSLARAREIFDAFH